MESTQAQTYLTATIHALSSLRPFYAATLQVLEVRFSTGLPTMGVRLEPKKRALQLFINPEFLCKLSPKERVGVLFHELEHITRGHLVRFPHYEGKSNEEHEKQNVCMDISINSNVANLPKGALYAKNYKDLKGNTLPDAQSTDWYLENMDMEDFNKKSSKGNGEKGESEGVGDHMWGDGQGELAEATGDLIKRAMVKASYDYSKLDKHIQDTLGYLESVKANLDFKGLLKKALKQSLRSPVRQSTWNRPNKRFGLYAKGNENGKLPYLSMFIDSSGSISAEELNSALTIVDEFLKVGAKKCDMNLFHTSNYYSCAYKRGMRPKLTENVESGGTDLQDSFDKLLKKNADLALCITDGIFGSVNVDAKKMPRVVFIISKDGDVNHPCSKEPWAITIKVK